MTTEFRQWLYNHAYECMTDAERDIEALWNVEQLFATIYPEDPFYQDADARAIELSQLVGGMTVPVYIRIERDKRRQEGI